MTTPERAKSRTGWTILIVAPNPLSKTRALHLRTRHLKAALAIAALCTLTIIGLGAVVAGDTLEVTDTSAQLDDAHRMILSLSDSLRTISDQETGSGDEEMPVTQAGKPADKSVARPAHLGMGRIAPGVVLPVFGRITSPFQRSRFHPILGIFRPHKGVDIAAPAGTNITAPAAARVVFVGRKLGHGLVVELDHGAGVRSRYAHCKSIIVREGDFVSFGDIIATVGSSGLSTAPHVHFEVLVRGQAIDPLKYLITPRLTPSETPATARAAAPVSARTPSVIQSGAPAAPAASVPAHPPERAPGAGSEQHDTLRATATPDSLAPKLQPRASGN
jgi:hypothetical protein